MGGQYGRSKAAILIEQGKYEEAVAEATRDMARDPTDPQPPFERAQALGYLARHFEAVTDFEQAITLDAKAGALDTDALDDAYFSALLSAAKQEATSMVGPGVGPGVDTGVKRLGRYAAIMPAGSHHKDASDWQKRLRGELKSEFVKER